VRQNSEDGAPTPDESKKNVLQSTTILPGSLIFVMWFGMSAYGHSRLCKAQQVNIRKKRHVTDQAVPPGREASGLTVPATRQDLIHKAKAIAYRSTELERVKVGTLPRPQCQHACGGRAAA